MTKCVVLHKFQWIIHFITQCRIDMMNLVMIFGTFLSVISTLRCFHCTTVGTNTHGMPRTTHTPMKSTTVQATSVLRKASV